MRHGLFFSTSLLLLCLIISTPVQSQLRKIYLNPKSIARESQTKFVDSIRFIPLEMKGGIEKSNSHNITITDKYILLNDYYTKTLFIYLKDGKFVKTINYGKLGDSFYPNYREATNQIVFFGSNKNYSLTPKDLIKIQMDWNNARNKKYFKKHSIDLNDSSLTLKKDIPDQKDIVRLQPLGEDYYVQGEIIVSPLYKDSLDYEMKLYKGSNLIKSFFPYNRINEPRYLYEREMVAISKSDTPNIFNITRPYCDTIYKLFKDSLSATYKVVFPLENTLPASYYTTSFNNKTDQENFHRNNGWLMEQLYIFHESTRFIYFQVSYLSNYDSYFYDKQTDITYKTKNIKPDSTQYNMQLLDTYGAGKAEKKFYKSQKAGDLLTFFSQNKSIAVPKELEAFLQTKPPATMPVIVEFTIKN
jgi:hypothetical protein